MNNNFNNGLFVVRHCKTQNNLEHRISGQSDSSIIDDLIDTNNLDRNIIHRFGLKIITSPAPRCLHTIELIGKQFSGINALKIDNRLLERGMGLWEGQLKDTLMAENFNAFINGHINPYVTPPNGESIVSFMQRINEFLDDLKYKTFDSPTLICAHNQTLKLLKFQLYGYSNLVDFWCTESFINGKVERLI